MNCPKCGTAAKNEQALCYNCGEILGEPEFGSESAREQYRRKLSALSDLLRQEVDAAPYMWNETAKKYALAVRRAQLLLGSDLLRKEVSSKLLRDMDALLARCRSAEFHIALVGAVKAGKSTLINALLGCELASTRVTPETAVLTKFRASDDKNYVRVSFYTQEEWNKLWESANKNRADVFLEEYGALNAGAEKGSWLGKPPRRLAFESVEELKKEIYEWTSSKTAVHYFVKEVEVGIAGFDLPKSVVFVDTPGLDDVVEFRSNVTRDYIDRANAVLMCVKADALTGQELSTILSVFANTRYNPGKVYVIGTQLDTLNRPEKDWAEQREEWLKYLRQPYGGRELAEKNLIPVSGYLYTLIKNFDSISESDDRYFDLLSVLPKFRVTPDTLGQHEKRLLDLTNIDRLLATLRRDVISKSESLMLDDIRESYSICREGIASAVRAVRERQQEVIRVSRSGIEEIRRKRAEYAKKLEEVNTDKKELETLVSTLRAATTKRVDELISQIKALGGE